MNVTTQEMPLVTKETQKTVLKLLCETPNLALDEIALALKTLGKNITRDEVLHVLQSISPTKNWQRASALESREEILNYLWNIEAQILYLLPVKQKDTTIAELNQMRLRNQQPKVSKDLIRHIQSLLMLDGKNLSKFRKFEKELSLQDDVDLNTQTNWALRLTLLKLNLENLISVHDLPELLSNKLQEMHPSLAKEVGKTVLRISEKFIERYFTKDLAEGELKALIRKYQSIFHAYKNGGESDLMMKEDPHSQSKASQNINEEIENIKKIIESSEGNFLSKLFAGSIKNKNEIFTKLEKIKSSVLELNTLGEAVSRSSNEKSLLVQKFQSDFENVLIVKSQLESDLQGLKDNLLLANEKNQSNERELSETRNSLEKAHEKIADLQQKLDKFQELENSTEMIRKELNAAKDLSLRLYKRTRKLKTDIYNKSPVS